MSTPKVLHIYCRVSSDIQLQGHSLNAQELAGIEKAKQVGLAYRVHIDAGKSAKDDDISNRPALTELLRLVDAGEVSDIFVTESDRMTRSPELHSKLKVKFMRHNIILHTLSGSTDYNNYDQEFMADIKALMNKRENSLKSARSIRGMNEAVKKGKWIGANLPYGFTKDTNGILIIDNEEVACYRQMLAWCFEGHGTSKIAQKLNDLNIPTRGRKSMPNGTKVVNKYTKSVRLVKNEEFVWRAGTVYCILTNTIYKGERRYKGEIISVPQIIDSKTWDDIQRQLKNNRIYSVNRGKNNFLLKGLLRCGCCGNNLYGKIKSDERIYMCSSKRYKSCGLRSVNLNRLESVVWERIINSGEYLTQLQIEWNEGGGEMAYNTSTQHLEALKLELNSLEQRSERLVELYELGRINLNKFDSRRDELKKSIDALNIKVKTAENKNAELFRLKSDTEKLFAGLKGLWNVKEKLSKLSFEEKRLLLHQLGTNIIIHWDSFTRIHRIELSFSVNGFAYAKKAILLPRGKTQAKIEYISPWSESQKNFFNTLYKHEAEYEHGFHVTEQASLRCNMEPYLKLALTVSLPEYRLHEPHVKKVQLLF